MSTQNVPTRLAALRAERRAALRRSLAYLGGLPFVAAFAVLHLVGPRAALVAALAALAAAGWFVVLERSAAQRRRSLLDDLILHGWRNVALDDVREREDELVAPRNRRLLARALENQIAEGVQPMPVSTNSRLVTLELRRHRHRIRGLAARLRDQTVEVQPRGVVLIEQLLSDGFSPLHAGPTEAIEPALERVERALAA